MEVSESPDWPFSGGIRNLFSSFRVLSFRPRFLVNTATARSPVRVLIVDDNQDAADSLAMLLEFHALAPGASHSGNQYEVRVAYDGIEGLRVAREFVPDCLVSDIQMPGLDGYALARAVRNEPALAKVKLVALSAFSDPEHIRRAAEAGFDYRLTKANHVQELLEVLKMIEEIKELATRTRELSEQNVDLAGQAKQLLQDVKEDVRELKQDVAELKQDVKELKDEHRDGAADTPPSDPK
jgi:two-component system OmpR family response regulator